MTHFHSIITILAVIVIIIAGIVGLQVAEQSYRTMLHGLGKAPAPQTREAKQDYLLLQSDVLKQAAMDPVTRGVIVGYWKMRVQVEDAQSRRLMRENEKYAQTMLRRYVKAQNAFLRHYQKYAMGASELIIETNGRFKIIDSELVQVVRARDKDTAVQGYYYKYRTFAVRSDGDSFIICAMPAEYGISGLYTLYVDQNGEIKKIDNQGQPIVRTMVIGDRVVTY